MSTFVQESVLPSFSFLYGGRPGAEGLSSWKLAEATEPVLGEAPCETRTRREFTDPATGLRLTARMRRFQDFPALDWVLELENTGAADTPILEQILPLACRVPLPADERLRLHYANGSLCQVDDFLPQVTDLGPGGKRHLAPRGGRSSNGVLPFMNFQRDGGGMILAVGWSGQWAVDLERDAEGLRVTAGMEQTHLRLHPGEKIRTPRILVLFWEGREPLDGQNALRRLLLAHYLPRVDGQLAMPPIADCLQGYYYLTGQAGAALELTALPKAAAAGAEVHWVDACWYGRSGREWWQEVGSWVVNRERFPQGLKPISDAAHRAGMKFILWFEPERVQKDTVLDKEHPEFLLRRAKEPQNALLNLGLPEARRHITDLVSGLIAENGVDIYRQDFNFDPLPYWQEADAPDRVGLTEIRHVEGHYEFWDELRRRHPGLWIDNCSSGGRRIDLETLARSVPLWPTDFQDVVGIPFGQVLHIGDQCASAGLARWVPLFGGGAWNFNPYGFRSRMSAGFTFGFHIPVAAYPPQDSPKRAEFKDVLRQAQALTAPDFPLELAREAIAECKTLRPFLLGDFYPLLPLTVSPHDWCAVQFHRPDLNGGIAFFFRRHASPFPKLEVALKCVDRRARYRVSLSPGYQEGPRQELTGRRLARLAIAIPSVPGCVLLRYEKVAE